MAILPAEQAKQAGNVAASKAPSPPAHRPLSRPGERTRRRALPRRRVRKLIMIGQSWEHLGTGTVWTVRQIHRKDWKAAMIGPAAKPRYVPFVKLGKEYRLREDGP